MQLKDTTISDREIAESRQSDDFAYLKGQAEFVLDMYRNQRRNLDFKVENRRREARQSIGLILVWIGLTLLFFLISNQIIMFLLPAILLAVVGFFAGPVFIMSAIGRNMEYAMMMEKLHVIKKKNANTFMDERRFLDNKIALYEDVLARCESVDADKEALIPELEKLSLPEEYHSEAAKYEFYLWPFFLLLVFWVLMVFLVW